MTSAIPVSSGAPALELRGVVKRYGDRIALGAGPGGIELEVAAGTILGLLGANGAGKSTLVGLAAGLTAPDEGTVRVAGRDPRSARGGRVVGVAPQESGVYPSLTVDENLRCFGELSGLSRAAARARSVELAQLLLLGELLPRDAGELSGGEQRRLHTAIALVHQPRLVLLDEPTVGADVASRAAILDVVRTLAHDGGAVLYTTHHLREIEELAGDVAVLDRGRLVTRSSVRELVARHAEPAVVLAFDGPVPEVTDARFARATTAGTTLRVAHPEPATAIAALLDGLGPLAAQLRSVEIEQPSLESAYTRLTGHGIAPDGSAPEGSTHDAPVPEGRPS
jgi:ABC-2 type transport system ATP-binding protein